MTSLESVCDNLYMEFANQGFEYWFGGSSYAIYKTPHKRKDIWHSFLNKYLPKYQQLALLDDNIKTKFRNSFFDSLFKLTDKKNKRKTIGYIPWYSPLIRVFFGGRDLVIVRRKENYTPITKKLKKNYDSFATKLKEDYIPSLKEDYDCFAAISKETYDYFTSVIKENYIPFIKKNYNSLTTTLKESYNCFTSAIRENYPIFATKVREDYIPSIKKGCKSFIAAIREGYTSLKKIWKHKS